MSFFCIAYCVDDIDRLFLGVAGGVLCLCVDGDGRLLGVWSCSLGCCCSGPSLPLPALWCTQVQWGESVFPADCLVRASALWSWNNLINSIWDAKLRVSCILKIVAKTRPIVAVPHSRVRTCRAETLWLIKDWDGNVLSEKSVLRRWQEYFEELQ